MFERLFTFIRQGVRDAILGGIADAQAELTSKIEAREPITIESTPAANGKVKRRSATR